jgi:hypothetical protein
MATKMELIFSIIRQSLFRQTNTEKECGQEQKEEITNQFRCFICLF